MKIIQKFYNFFFKKKEVKVKEKVSLVKMPTRKFGAMRRVYNNEKSGLVFDEFPCLGGERHEIWHFYYTENKYGDTIKAFEQLGCYYSKSENLYYKEDLKKYIEKKYFNEKDIDY